MFVFQSSHIYRRGRLSVLRCPWQCHKPFECVSFPGGSSLGSGGSRRSSPSSDTITLEPMTSSISEVLPPRTVLTDGGDSYHRFRSLPNRNNRHHCNASSAKDAINGNIGNVRNNAQIPVTMSNGGGGHVRSPRHPMEGVADFLVGSRQADVEDLYAKVISLPLLFFAYDKWWWHEFCFLRVWQEARNRAEKETGLFKSLFFWPPFRLTTTPRRGIAVPTITIIPY